MIKDEGYPSPILQLAQENVAHSDDEQDPNNPSNVYLIRKKIGRADKVTSLFRGMDHVTNTYF